VLDLVAASARHALLFAEHGFAVEAIACREAAAGPRSPCAWFLLTADNYVVSGSIRLGSLFLTLPTRVLTGQQVIPPEG
jgi:hypothetical protein